MQDAVQELGGFMNVIQNSVFTLHVVIPYKEAHQNRVGIKWNKYHNI